LHERTTEYFKNASDFSEGSHMVKHWLTSHEDEETCPKEYWGQGILSPHPIHRILEREGGDVQLQQGEDIAHMHKPLDRES
jgi:hypothetical protein